jgi:hypothetical protein
MFSLRLRTILVGASKILSIPAIPSNKEVSVFFGPQGHS